MFKAGGRMSGWKDLFQKAKELLSDQREADSLTYPAGSHIWKPAELKPFHDWLVPYECQVAEGLGQIVGVKAYHRAPVSQREDTLNRVSSLVAQVLGFSPPAPVVIDPHRRQASWYSQGLIVIHQQALDSVRVALATALHESLHAYQKKCIDQWRRGELPIGDPRGPIVPVWAHNFQHYIQPQRGLRLYERQPVEFHANRFADRILARLDWLTQVEPPPDLYDQMYD